MGQHTHTHTQQNLVFLDSQNSEKGEFSFSWPKEPEEKFIHVLEQLAHASTLRLTKEHKEQYMCFEGQYNNAT